MAWIAHFMIGAIWGVLFAAIVPRWAGDGFAWKGAILAMVPWALMMIVLMPMAGAGLFGLSLGIMAPLMTLVLHLIFGAVLGATYAALVGRSGMTSSHA